MEVREQIAHSEQLIRTGRFAEAIGILTDVLAEEPQNEHALLNIGIAYTENGDNDSAVQALQYYVDHNEQNDEAWEALGCACLRMKDYEAAERHLVRARQINPENASVLRNLSVLLSQTGRGRASFVMLKKSYDLNPDDYLTTYALATAYRHLKRIDDAKELLERLSSFEYVPTGIRRDAEQHFLEMTIGWS